jgi:hypothetical protein
LHGFVNGVELVVACDLLDQCPAVILKDDEVADEVEQAALLKQTLNHNLKLRGEAGATSSPSMVRQGIKRSVSAVSEPTRASKPSEITSREL